MNRFSRTLPGFTLVELLVVIVIISLLATLAITRMAFVSMKARQTETAYNLREMSKILENYRLDHGAYPVAGWFGEEGSCWYEGGYYQIHHTGPNYIPGVVPDYISQLPTMPGAEHLNNAGCDTRTYIYLSKGKGEDYKLFAHSPENCADPQFRNIVDPRAVTSYVEGGGVRHVDGVGYVGYDPSKTVASCYIWSIYTPRALLW